MCLTPQENKKFTMGFLSVMITLLTLGGGVIWSAADANRRLIVLEYEKNGDRFTQEEGDVHAFQIQQTLDIVAKLRVTLEKVNHQLEQGRIYSRTHHHGTNGAPPAYVP